jgi:putative ABC transport system permease protein
MRLFRLLILRSLFSHLLRTLLISFGIILGVASILAIGMTNQAAMQAIERLFRDTSGKSDLMITSADTADSGFPDSLLRRVSNLPGVSAAVPSLQISTVLADKAASNELGLSFFGASLEGGLLIYGIDPTLDEAVRDYSLVEGRFLDSQSENAEVVLVKDFATENEISLGQRIELLTPQGTERFLVVGLMAKEGPGQLNNGSFGVMRMDMAQKLFDRSGELDRIDIVVEKTSDSSGQLQRLESIQQTLQSRLGREVSVIFPASQGRRMTQMLSSYQIGLNFMSGMALFVGAFLIYNAFSMTVVERTREFGMLRTIGLTRRQTTNLVLAEATLLGLVSSALGVGLGLLMAFGLARGMELMLGYSLRILEVPPDALLTSVLVGIITTLLAAFIPAWQAGRISPLEALRVRGRVRDGLLIRRGWIAGLALLGIAAYLLIWNPFPYDVQFRLGSLAVFTLFIGGTLVIPPTVGVLERLVRPVLQVIFGPSGRLGGRNIQRARLRTALTVAALMVGLSLTLVTQGITASFKVDLLAWINAYLGGDVYVSSSVGLRSDFARRLEAIQGVEAAAPIRYFEVKWRRSGSTDESLTFMAIDPLAYLKVTDFVFSDNAVNADEAALRLARGDAVFISSVLAERYGLTTGDSIRLKTASGWREFAVVGVVVDFYNQGLVVTGSQTDMRRYFKINDTSTLLLKLGANNKVSDILERIDSLYGKRYRLTLISNASIRERVNVLMGQAFSMFDVMAMISVIVASLGVINTLTMNVMERTQEIGMLRSIGTTRLQISLMILAEAGVIGVAGGALGLVFGILLSRIFLAAMMAMSGYRLTYTMPIEGIAFSLILALVISQVAAFAPARRASRIAVLEAIHYE